MYQYLCIFAQFDMLTHRNTCQSSVKHRKLSDKNCQSLELLKFFYGMVYQTLSIRLGIQLRQRYSQIKDEGQTFFLNIFNLAWPSDPRGPGTYLRFVQSPLMIDLWMEECPILMIFSSFWWKWRWSPSQD